MDITTLNKSEIIIFGAGHCGKECLQILNSFGYKTKYILDNNTDVIGNSIDGVKIYGLPKLVLEPNNLIIIGSVKYEDEIRTQLKNYGVLEKQIITINELYESISKGVANNLQGTLKIPQETNTNRIHLMYDWQIFTSQKRGGISRYYQELIKYLSNTDGYLIDFFEGLNISELIFEINDNKSIIYNHWENNEIKSFYLREKINNRLINDLNKGEKINIYHPTYYFPTNFNHYQKKVITVYDMIHEIYDLDKETIRAKEKAIFEADGIIAISNNTKNDILNFYKIKEEKIKVIYLANSLGTLFPNKKGKKEEPYILFVGNRSGYKNFKTLINAYANSRINKDYCLLCFGGKEFSLEEKDMINSLGIENKVKYLRGDDKLLANVYQNASLFVYPSMYEGFGLPVLEAMHFGIPVITTNRSSLPEIAGNAAVFFDGYSVEELIWKMEKILGDKEIYYEMSQKGKEREGLFSWEKTAKDTDLFYKEIITLS